MHTCTQGGLCGIYTGLHAWLWQRVCLHSCFRRRLLDSEMTGFCWYLSHPTAVAEAYMGPEQVLPS